MQYDAPTPEPGVFADLPPVADNLNRRSAVIETVAFEVDNLLRHGERPTFKTLLFVNVACATACVAIASPATAIMVLNIIFIDISRKFP